MIIRHVHLPLISRDFLMTTVDSEPLVRENPDCKELMLEVSVAVVSLYLSVVCQSKFKTLTKLVLEVGVADLQIYAYEVLLTTCTDVILPPNPS